MLTKEEIFKALGKGKYSAEQLADVDSCIFHTLIVDDITVFISEYASGDLYGSIFVTKGKKQKHYAGFESERKQQFLQLLKDKIQSL